MPLIERISCQPLHVPLQSALTWGRGHELAALEHVLVRVDLSDGAVGIAEATPRPSIYGETSVSAQHIIAAELAPRLHRRPISDFEAVAQLSAELAHIKANNTARGALDIAMHQALAQSRGDTLREYLGGARESLRLSSIISAGDSDRAQADVAAAYARGIRVFKIKIGRNIPAESDSLRDMMTAFPAARFYVDANETLPLATAAQTLDTLREYGALYCEEPLPVHRLRERRWLRQQTAMPLIADDSAFTPSDLQRELDFDTFDILNIKPARTGYSQSREMLLLAAARGKGAMVGSQASSLLGCLQAALFAGRAEVDCPSECSFYLKLKTEADLELAPDIVAGCWSLAAVERALWALCEEITGISQ
ncbi:MAG: enolase [Chloroflexi bacterium]|nr:enolase [Chloroflexota bacterium]MCY4246450.1 enolase [Chloroflexota bacterium]